MPPKSRAPPSPKRHELSSDDDDLSDLSDLDDRYGMTSNARAIPAPAPLSTDDDAENEDEDEEDPETPEDAEEDYISPEDDAASTSASDSYDDDDDDDHDGPPKSNAARGAAAASARAAAAKRAAASKPGKKSRTRKPTSPSSTRRKSVGQPITKATRGRAAAPTRTHSQQFQSSVSPRATRSSFSDFTQGPAERESVVAVLRISKERLRAVTRHWGSQGGGRGGYPPTGPATQPPQRAAARKPQVQSYEDDDTSPDPSDDEEDAEGEEDEDMMFDQDGQMPDANVDNDIEMDIDAEGEDDLDDNGGEELLDEDAEGETDEEILDSDGDTGMDVSRTGTPGDLSRLTSRQRTRMGDITTADHLLELPSGYGKSNKDKDLTLTAQEQELKRAEMARRRKHLTDQRLHEEKMDTINRLLKKQTPKMRGSRGTVGEAATPAGGAAGDGDALAEKPPPPNMLRWVSRKEGTFVGVPESWLSGPVGEVFMKQERTPRMRRLVEEIE